MNFKNLNINRYRKIAIFGLTALFLIIFIVLPFFSARAADGSGTNAVSPTSTNISTTGNTFTFTFTAAETMDSGGIAITTPSGWSSPTGTAGTAGFTVATSSSGMVATVEDVADSATGWGATGACTTAAPAATTTVKQEGTGSVVCRNGNESTGDVWFKNITAQNWSAYTKVGFWIRSSLAVTAGRLQFSYDNSGSLASPLESISVGGLSANTWTYVVLSFGATTRTSVTSYGFRVNNNAAVDNANVYVDDILLGPGAATFPGGNSINVRILQLANTQTLTVTYGSGGGSSGVTAPSVAGIGIATTTARSSDSGTLTNIASHPTLTAKNPAPTTTSISPTSTNLGGGSFTLTVNGTNFISTSAVNWNGSSRTTTFVSSTQLTATITAADIAQSGTSTVTVVNPTPGGGTSNSQSFLVTHASPTLASISPTSTNVGGAQFTLTLIGTGFDASSTVQWNGSNRATTFSSSTQLTATITAADIALVGTSTVTVVNPTPGGGTSASQNFVVKHAAPTTTSINPTSTNAGGSQFTLTVNGTGFDTSSTVQWNGSNRTTSFVSATQVTATINAGDIASAGTASVTVVSPTPGGGTSNAQTFTINNPVPVLSSISPTSTTSGGSDFTLTLTGSNFVSTSVVRLDGSDRATTFVSSTQLTATILAADIATAGTSSVAVFNPTPGGGASNSQTLTIVSPEATSFALNHPGTMGAGTRAAYIVTRKDTNGNPTTFSTNVVYLYTDAVSSTARFYDAASGGNVITSVTISSGTSTAAFWYYDEAPGTKTVTVSDNAASPDGATGIADATDSIVVNTGATTKFLLNHPGTTTVGERAAYVVTREDQVNNLVTSGLDHVYLYTTATTTGTFYNVASGGSPITSVDITNGNATTTFWYTDTVPGTKTVTASDNATSPDGPTGITDATDSITFVAGPTASYTLSHPGTMFARTRVGYTVTRKDEFANAVTSGTSTVYLYTNSASANAKFYADNLSTTTIASVEIQNGQSFASFYYFDDTAATVTITASDNATAPDGATGIADGTDSLTVLPVAVKFVIVQPTDGTVDAPINVTVQAEKPDNSVDVNYQSDVTLNVTGSATGGGLVDIINGVGTINISDTVAETVTLSLSDSQSTGLDISSTKQVTFGVGALAQYTLNHPGSIGAGTRAAYTVTRKDQYGNLVTSGTATAYLYSNSSSSNKQFYSDSVATTSIVSVTFGAGQSSANFWYYDDALGTWTITVSDNSTAPDGAAGVNDAADSLTVTPGAVASFTLSHPGTITAGTRAAYAVTRKDIFGNLITAGSTNVYLYSDSVSTSSAFYLVSSGGSPTTLTSIDPGNSSSNFWYTDGTPGTYTITASDNPSSPDGAAGVTDGTDSLVVSAAPIVATRFVILDPGAATVDAGVTVTVQAQDNSGNLDTTYSGGVTLNTNGSATGGGLVTITNGVGTKVISDTMAQTVALTLTDTNSTGLDVSSSRNLVFAPGVIAQFTVSVPGDMAAGTRLATTLTRKDQFGNLVTSGLTTAYLYSASTNPNKKFFDASSGGSAITSANITSGQSSAQVWYYDEAAATTTVTVSDNATSSDGLTGIADASTFVHVIPGATAKFVLNNPGDIFAGTRAAYTVTRKDEFNNPVTQGIGLAYLWSNSTGANKKFYDSAGGTIIITSAAIDDGNSSANFWYFDDEPGTWTITASNNSSGPSGTGGFTVGTDSITVSLVPIVATKIVILPAGPSQIGSPVLVTVQAEDNSGNTQTDYNNSVTLNVTGAATGGGVVNIVNGIGVASVNDFTAETVDLSLTDTNATGLDVSSVASVIFQVAPVLQPGFVGGGTPSSPSRPVVGGISFSGRAYPGAKLSIVALGSTATVLRQSTIASNSGLFQVDFRGISTGARSYGLLVQDKDGRTAQSKTYDVNLKNASDILSVSNILTSPTIGFSRPTVTKGDRLIVLGYATPGSTVSFQMDGKAIIEKAQTGSDGSYKLLLRTGELSLGSHVISAKQFDLSGRTSDASPQKVFSVTNLLVPQVDFNNDGRIDVKDWSIFLGRWNSKDAKVRILDDLNGDGKTDATDFSIFIRTLRVK